MRKGRNTFVPEARVEISRSIRALHWKGNFILGVTRMEVLRFYRRPVKPASKSLQNLSQLKIAFIQKIAESFVSLKWIVGRISGSWIGGVFKDKISGYRRGGSENAADHLLAWTEDWDVSGSIDSASSLRYGLY